MNHRCRDLCRKYLPVDGIFLVYIDIIHIMWYPYGTILYRFKAQRFKAVGKTKES
ncbi:hypothetical protein [Faecalicatena contorta]|uniref:hypothetical protein n=1 Tax=Faecalicatena contorta TaxID=39482 RepID=UPI001F2163C5|nr:hypothetical protein [Faecalicatena contorta]MCF2682881.1 hypothetical protein [Faecalicatena contorta]